MDGEQFTISRKMELNDNRSRSFSAIVMGLADKSARLAVADETPQVLDVYIF